jgi:hypothetical protein
MRHAAGIGLCLIGTIAEAENHTIRYSSQSQPGLRDRQEMPAAAVWRIDR